MTEIALHLEIRIEAKRDFLAVLQVAAEFRVQGSIGQIGDVRRHTRNSESFARAFALVEVMPAMPIGIGHNGLTTYLVEGNVLRGVSRRTRDRDRGEDAFLVSRSPLEDLHAAHGAANDAEHLVNA